MELTKHEQIIRFIEGLKIGQKVSVRQLAKELDVSEGTAYRAIKEAEARGLVSSIPKVGTIRIEPEEAKEIEDLNLNEVSQIVDGIFLTHKTKGNMVPTKFVVGAVTPKSLIHYVTDGCLLLVGDQTDLQMTALQKNCSLLITGGFTPPQEVIAEAEKRGLPVILTPYEAFIVTSLINRAVYERLTRRELLLVEDVMVTEVYYLEETAKVADWHRLAQLSGHSRFPVVNREGEVLGIATAVDVAGISSDVSIVDVMTKDVLTARKDTLLTHLARLLVWEGYELIPVLDGKKLVGVISHRDILKAFQQTTKQPHVGETVDNIILSGFRLVESEAAAEINGEINEYMIDEFGSASFGTLATLMTSTGYIAIRKQFRLEPMAENFTVYQIRPAQVGEIVTVTAAILHTDKKNCKVDLTVSNKDGQLLAKGLMQARIFKK